MILNIQVVVCFLLSFTGGRCYVKVTVAVYRRMFSKCLSVVGKMYLPRISVGSIQNFLW